MVTGDSHEGRSSSVRRPTGVPAPEDRLARTGEHRRDVARNRVDLWTAVVLAAVILIEPGQVPPCPQAVRVGLSEAQRVEILRMCADRAQLGPGPLIGLPIC